MDRTQYRHLGFAAALLALPMTGGGAAADHFRVLHSFCQESGCPDGQEPYAGLVSDAAGNLYGTTHAGGGAYGAGTVFELAPDPVSGGWTYKVLHRFGDKSGRDNVIPVAPLIVDVAGNLYGTTFGTGQPGSGSIFRLSPNSDRSHWSLTILHRFCMKPECADGEFSDSGLTYAGAATGQLYNGYSPLFGTTTFGGISFNDGVAFELKPRVSRGRWSYRVIHEFCEAQNCSDGYLPYSALVMDSVGNLYGSTDVGGALGGGTVFQLHPGPGRAWSYSVVYNFCQASGCADGRFPGNVTLGLSGAILGAAGGGSETGCGSYDCGVIFKLTPHGSSWDEEVLHTFCSSSGCPDGFEPTAVALSEPTGAQYGATQYGGGNNTDPKGLGGGVLFERTDRFRVHHRFCALPQCADGAYPIGNLLTDAQGNVFGVTQQGGANGAGVIYEFTP